MKKDIPLTIEIFPRGEEDRHRLTSAKEIKFVLHHIAEKGTRVALYFGGANDFILTTLLSVNDTGLWLEQSPNDPDNQRITGSGKLVFVSAHLQAKVQFTGSHARSLTYQGYPAIYLPLPGSLYRIQRREHFRLMAPADEPLRCVIPTGKQPKKQLREFTIMDISGGGVRLTCAETDTELVPGASYPNCRIDLPEVGTISGTIEVRTLNQTTSASGHVHKHAGCKFTHLDGQSTILLQRYMMNIQRAKARP